MKLIVNLSQSTTKNVKCSKITSYPHQPECLFQSACGGSITRTCFIHAVYMYKQGDNKDTCKSIRINGGKKISKTHRDGGDACVETV